MIETAATLDATETDPQSWKLEFFEPSDVRGETVEFRLIYRGKLPAATSSDPRARQKQLIRKQLHKQLRVLWQDHRALNFRLTAKEGEALSEAERIANDFARCGYRFVPLIRKSIGVACSLDILFLRRDSPGNLVKSGGDIDNRLKVLLDGLRMPDSLPELGGFAPELDEDPFFCLLEDDVLISDLSISTDRLLTPKEDDEHIHDVMLVIRVTTKALGWQGLMSYGF
jgi:hypothetical protein